MVTLDELAAVANCSAGKPKLGYRVLDQELGLAAAVRRPRSLVPMVASECNAPEAIRRRATGLAAIW